MRQRYFTAQEANATLPFVERVVRDVVQDYARWKDALEQFELATGGATADGGEPPAAELMRAEVDALAERIEGYIEELDAVGCSLKGFEEGLVDFRARLDGRDIFLCWQLGEPEVGWWHELDDGYAGRQELEPALREG